MVSSGVLVWGYASVKKITVLTIGINMEVKPVGPYITEYAIENM